MNKYFNTITNARGDVLAGYRVQVTNSNGAIVDIFTDKAGTRFTDKFGFTVNYATAGEAGKAEFYWTAAEGQVLQVLDANGNLEDSTADFADNFVLENLGGAIGQSQVTDLSTDLAAKENTADLAAAGGAARVGYQKTGTATVVRDVSDRMQERVSILDYGDVLGTDASAALTAAHDDLPAAGGEIFFPKGAYSLSTNHVFTKPIALIGEGCSPVNNGNAPTKIEKAPGVSGAVIEFQGLGSRCEGIGFQGIAGNTGDGIQISGGRFRMVNCSIHGMGQDGLRIGNAAGANCNLFSVDTLYARSNGRHGVYVDDEKHTTSVGPDANGGVLNKIETLQNGGDGIRLYRCWYITIIGDVPQLNTGFGLHIINDGPANYVGSRYHTILGGEQNEGNTAGNIETSGFRCTFVGIQPGATFNDTGLGSNVIRSENSKLDGLTLSRPLTADSSSGTTQYPVVVQNRSNAANGRGVGVEFRVPNGSDTARLSGRIEVEQDTTNKDYMQFVLNNGGTLVDYMRLSSNNASLLPLTDNGLALGLSGNKWSTLHVGTAGVQVSGTKVVGAQQAAIADSAGGDEQAKINAILAAMRAHGLIAT